MVKGGLLRELEQKIKASQDLLNTYEIESKHMEEELVQLSIQYENSYNDWRWYSNQKELETFRQTIINTMLEINDKLTQTFESLCKQRKITKFLMDCYYYVQKSVY